MANLVISYSTANVPELCRSIASILSIDVSFTLTTSNIEHIPYITTLTNEIISGDVNISKFFSRSYGVQLYGNNDAILSSQIDQWLDYYIQLKVNNVELVDAIPFLNEFFERNSYLVGYSLSLADVALVLVLKRLGYQPSDESPHLSRWFSFVTSQLPFPKPLTAPKAKVAKVKPASNKNTTAENVKSTSTASNAGEEGTCPPLDGAIEGEVCTRFPPEPSGYLHIGHCKAVLLNQYYAQRYKGKLIVRFDDTNPSKEKEEYAENILKDLETLGVKADKVTHTSDHFAICEEYARKIILSGNAYMDDTDQETMQAERLDKKESKRRNTPPESNLELFELLLKGDPSARTYCLRAKIDMTSVNGTLRDPVLYRFNDTPHHRTGSTYKAYPTYDFACPIVDSVEGVTHALRTTEYNDRDEQYHWIIKALNIRDVKIMTYGKINFVNTVLSKRKLQWFVESKLVDSWFDPRFPTIQGCIRRGMDVDVLKHFILSQGASKRVITMEWDKFWSENKKKLEEIAPRYMAVNDINKVLVRITNVPSVISGHSVQVHPQKPELGYRTLRRYNEIYIDQIDSINLKVNEEITILRWGNMIINKIDINNDNVITAIDVTYDPSATNFSKTKKITWLANVDDNIICTVVEFDHLISKAKLNDDEDFKDFINPNSRSEFQILADPYLKTLQAGSVIQLERKGFFRVDQSYNYNSNKGVVLFAIPDGKIQKNTK